MVKFTSLFGAAAVYASLVAAAPMAPMASMAPMSGSPPSMSGSSSSMSPSSSDCGSSGCGSSSSSSGMSSSDCGSSDCGMSSSSNSTTTMASEMTSTSMASSSYYTPSYGSGSSSSSSSSSSSYDSCVQQCVAQFGQPSSVSWSPPAESSSSTDSSSASGSTHTVMVAPAQGVLRYVPFAVNASVGDTVKYIWGGGPHTVTKSSLLGICNKTDVAPVFASGQQNKSFVFTQVVNDTNPTFFYCGVGTHCEQGMFGIINPPNANVAPSSIDNMMPAIAANNSGTSAAWAYTNSATSNNSAAAAWGGSMDTTGVPSWAVPMMADNVMYTRAFMAANPEAITPEGNLDMSLISAGSMMSPPDVVAAAAAGAASTTAAASPAATAAASPAASSAAATQAPVSNASSSNGAGVLASPRVAVAFVAAVAAFFAL